MGSLTFLLRPFFIVLQGQFEKNVVTLLAENSFTVSYNSSIVSMFMCLHSFTLPIIMELKGQL